MAGRRILVTGVGSHVGTELAALLAQDPDVEHVAGLDMRPPRRPLPGVEVIEADIRDPEIATVIPALGVDTVVHEHIVRQPGGGLGPKQAHDINVIGTLQLLAGCGRLPGLRAIVIRGSAGIYGVEPAQPQFLTEEMSRLYPMRTRFQRDILEIENLFRGFAQRHPGVTCMMLRYQPAIGPQASTQVTRYLSLPVAPTYLGFDPRIQLVHQQDGLDALIASIRNPVRGAVNVACPGTIGLTRMLRLAGRPTLPVPAPAFPAVADLYARAGMISLSPDFRRLLQYGRGLDITRLVEEVGFEPRHTTKEAVMDYVRAARGEERRAA